MHAMTRLAHTLMGPFLAATLCGCANLAPAQTTLAGTTWRLVAIQSMDDAQGSLLPDDPSRYTVTFGAEGRAAFRLDCNRGTASWTASPSAADATSGQLIFGALAGTRAMCPPGSLDQKLTRQLPQVRSYLLKDGRLHLSLLADGGTLSWMPAP
jgi:heat shock protein HslJ